MEYLSVVNYFFGVGGMLLLGVLIMVTGFVLHVREFNMTIPVYEFIALFYIGGALGLTLFFITIPTLCFIRPILMCYRVM
jgi:hypothetical protein